MSTTVMQAPAGVVGQVQTAYGNASIGSTGLVTVDSRAVASLQSAGFTVTDSNRAAGTHVTTSGEAGANTLTIATGLAHITSAIVQVLDAGNNVVTTDADVTWSAGNLTIADGATYNTVAGQVINWEAFGY